MGRKTKLSGTKTLTRRRRKAVGNKAESRSALELNRQREAPKR